MGFGIVAVPGVVIVAYAIREMFHDLFHPSVGGSVSEFVARRIFGLLRRRPTWLPLAGPLALVLIIFTWAILLAIGFALIYYAVSPNAYDLEAGMEGPRHGFWTAFYFSLEVMTTLGLGDIKPRPDWLRVLVVLHTLVGFAFVTASLTWVVLIFPALSRIRALAMTASVLVEAERRTGSAAVSPDSADVLAQLTAGVIQFRIDLIHFPILYYFRSDNENADMARSIGYIERFARQAAEHHRTERLRFVAASLMVALEQCAEVLGDRFKHADARNPGAVFRAYAEHHVRALGE